MPYLRSTPCHQQEKKIQEPTGEDTNPVAILHLNNNDSKANASRGDINRSKRKTSVMKVRDLMKKNVTVCETHTSLAAAAVMMWDSDCGVLPVVGPQGQVVGIITDRDIAIALATKGKPGSEISVGEVTSGRVDSCSEDDDMKRALQIMGAGKFRRLPVLGHDGKLQGIISINDAIVHAHPDHPELSNADVMIALKSICEFEPAKAK